MTYPPYPNTSESGPPLFPGRPMPGWALALIVATGALVVLALLMLVGFSYVYGKNHEDMRFPSDDVTVSSCRLDATTGRPMAEVRVTSRATRRGTYTVPLVFRDLTAGSVKNAGAGSAREAAAGHSTAVVADLAVGATASRQVTGPVPVLGLPECEIGDVTFLSTAAPATASGL
ncbi:hypothetical protein P8A18_22065 [Streptomyces castrisilvae]|uniref:Secreted protein n=1 Tax=Streptomyces castrisilvae TaxID=3033811 RepID=A0ABY9HN19_9ACTN|nr:hypothetical protein [Streptomyces sp. Mut1]WLQ35946.1 hypothetical protein P8A18_22065 [Streptomyces sp. Mut1]